MEPIAQLGLRVPQFSPRCDVTVRPLVVAPQPAEALGAPSGLSENETSGRIEGICFSHILSIALGTGSVQPLG